MFIDEGITGTTTKNCEDFKTMIADALSGKIDLILTKSVSRFARNTVDTLTHVRKLKDAGVEVFLRKKTSGRRILKANYSSPSCPAWHKKNHAPYPRT